MIFGIFLKKTAPYFEIVGRRILLQKMYPFLSEIMDERGVILSLTLPGQTGVVYKF